MELDELEDKSIQELENRKTELWDIIKDKFDGDTAVVAEICEIEYEMTKREFVGEDPMKELAEEPFSID